jgi:hypothetical protein
VRGSLFFLLSFLSPLLGIHVDPPKSIAYRFIFISNLSFDIEFVRNWAS